MTQTTLKLIQVGCGEFGYSWVKVVKESKDWEAVAYVDIDQEKLKKIRTDYNVSEEMCFKSFSEALRKVDADAILAPLPIQVHAEVCLEALNSGLHTLVEKPIADSMEKAKEIVENAERRGLRVMVDQNYRFRRGTRAVRNLLEKRIVGDPGYVTVSFHRSYPREWFSVKWRQIPDILLANTSIHHFDLVRYILQSNAVSVYAKSWKPDWSWFDGKTCVTANFEMENKTVVAYFGSSVSRGWETAWDGDWKIACSNGEVHWNDGIRAILKSPPGVLEAEPVPLELEDRAYILHEFARAILEEREPEVSGRDNLNSLAMLFAAIDSSRTGRVINLESYL